MSYSNGNIGAEINNRDKYYAALKPQLPQAQAAAEQAIQAKDQKASGVTWAKKGDETVVSTQGETDTLALSFTSVPLTAPAPTPTVNPAANVKESLNSFRRSLVESLKEKIASAVRKSVSYNLAQGNQGLNELDGIMSKLFLRLGPALLASLGENPNLVSEIKERVFGELRTENGDKMKACVEAEVKVAGVFISA